MVRSSMVHSLWTIREDRNGKNLKCERFLKRSKTKPPSGFSSMMARFNSGGPEAHMLRMQAHLDEYENQFKKEPSKEDVQKAVQGACGKMDAENRITSGPLKNPQELFEWLKSIHFQGPMLKMLTDNDLLTPKCWLGGGKSSGKMSFFGVPSPQLSPMLLLTDNIFVK